MRGIGLKSLWSFGFSVLSLSLVHLHKKSVSVSRLALHPQLSGVVEVDVEYRLEEIVAGEGCEAIGQAIGDIRGGSMIVGLRGAEGFSPQPPADTTIGPGDTLVAIGTPATLGRLERLLAPPSAVSRG